MKRFILLFCLAGLISSARATITPITDTSTNLTLDFSLVDNFITPQGVTNTYNMVNFPGTSLTLYFQDRIVFLGNREQLSTNPTSGTYNYVQNLGNLDFFGTYSVGQIIVNWSVDSVIDTNLGNDRWRGTFSAVALYPSVPDAGSTAGLFGLGLVAMALVRRRR